MLRSQDVVFTLYGDYVRYRGGEAWTGSLIELLGLLGMSEQAVRSTLSRMSRKGWLKGRRAGNKSFYSLTPKSIKLLEEGAQRIFQPRTDEWDGRWCLLIYSIPEQKRHLRNKLRERLTWLGYAPLNHATWISPRFLQHELDDLLGSLKIRGHVQIFCGEHLGFASNREVVARCWNLEGLNQTYADFIAKYEPLLNEHKAKMAQGNSPDPGDCFVQRFMLVHEYRSFPYVDPNLPTELLPDDWLRDKALQVFREYHELLTAGANTFMDDVFARAPSPRK